MFLTSVMKNMDVAVRDTHAAAEGDFEGGSTRGTLENEGVAIAPFNDFDDQVPQEVKDASRTCASRSSTARSRRRRRAGAEH